jgi:leader peptidase (prepilin peptidase)/N-methyltransferase
MINFFFYIPIFILGLAVGSFLNCVIYRLEKNESFLIGRSYCPKCKHQLGWQDLIPLLSFLELGGKCRYCKQKISWQYPLVELATGILFVSVFHIAFPNLLLSIYYFLISSLLIVIFTYDLKYYIIPDEIIYPAIVITFLYNIFYSCFMLHSSYSILNILCSGLGASAFFLAIFLISKGKWLGFGDVKLAFFMGLFLGFPNILVAFFISFLIGAIIGLGLIFCGKKSLKSEVPFGPFLVTGTFLALFLGNQIINWYFNLFI